MQLVRAATAEWGIPGFPICLEVQRLRPKAARRRSWHGSCGNLSSQSAREVSMKRREFLRSMTALAASTAITTPAIFSAAKAASRKETLLLVTENGPHNLHIPGIRTNRPGYESSWNCYDRLITHEKKTLSDGSISYDRDKLKGELADDMNIGDMSVTFKLKKTAKFHDGTPVTANDVKWSFDRAVSVGGFPTVQIKGGSRGKKEEYVVVDDATFLVHFIKKNPFTLSDAAGCVA